MKLETIARNTQRTDDVFDIYEKLKQESRGKGLRESICESTSIPNNFNKLIRHDENKTELFQMLSDSFVTLIHVDDSCFRGMKKYNSLPLYDDFSI